MKQLLILFISLTPFALSAQVTDRLKGGPNEFMYDGFGRPVFLRSDIEVNGSPYFAENYCHADIKVRKGKTYYGVKTKLNLETNSMIYVDATGKEMEAVTPVDRIEFRDCKDPSKNKVIISGLPPIDRQDESSFYVLLDSGNVSLLKYMQVSFTEKRNNFGNANIIRTYQQYETYYSYTPGKGLTKLNKDQEAVLSALGDKSAQVSSYITANNIKLKKEADLVKVFSYYNSLR